MRWEKLGKIFDPTEHQLPFNCKEFAQSPQVLVLKDCVRIYFSTREREESTGKYLSRIAFVEMDKRLQRVKRISQHQVIPLGELGCFDEHGIFPINILKKDDRVLAYTCGWSRRVSVSVDTGIGFAVSHDSGETFDKFGGGPIMSIAAHEPFLVGDAFVKYYAGRFQMWYIFGTHWKQFGDRDYPDRIYKIGHAVSEDGIVWERNSKQIIAEKFDDESQALPTVVEIDGRYHMFFCYRHSYDFRKNKDRAYRIGYAYSDDLSNWVRDDASVGINVSDGGWDSDMLCYPHVFKHDGNVYLLYNGNEFGRYGFGLAKLLSL